MRMPFRGVGKRIQKLTIISLATLVAMSGLAGSAPLFLSQKAYATPVSSVVYDSLANVVPDASYTSQPFQAQQTYEFGDSVHLGGTNRRLDAVKVTMVTWATYTEWSSDARYSASGWTHPLTLNVYGTHLGANGAPDTLLATTTQSISIPWRPVGDPSCPVYTPGGPNGWKDSNGDCHFGYAFNASFDMSGLNTVMPNDVIVGIAYNTQSYGVSPIGTDGPYNSLNVAVPPNQAVSVGSDSGTNAVFWNTSTCSYYTAPGTCNVFREDTNWSPYGTVPLQITASASDDVYVNSSYSAGNAGGHTFGYDAFSSVSSAIASVVPGGTVHVADGDYSGEGTISITKAVNLVGEQADVVAASTSTGTPRSGSESILNRLFITSGNVTVNGFSFNSSSASGQLQVLSATTLSGINIKNNIFSGYDNVALPTNGAGNIRIEGNYFTNPSPSAEAIQIKTSSNAGDCSGTQILNNVFDAATTNGAADINLSCTGSNSTNVTVSGNRSMNASDPNDPNMVAFSGITDGVVVSNNTANTSGSNVFFYGSVSGSVNISGNTFSSRDGGAVSIYGGDYPYVPTSDTPNTGSFNVNNNSFDNIGIRISASGLGTGGSVNASMNYWGSANPNFASLVSSGVTTSPYFTNAAMTVRSDNKVVPDNSGNATVDNTNQTVVVNSSSQPVSITVTGGTTNPTVDFSALVSGNSGVVPQTTITAPAATVNIPSSTTVTASGGTWDGTIAAPTVTSVNIGSDKVVSTAIEVGANGIHLSFSNAVRLLLPGQTGKKVGFINSSGFTEITDTCSADSQAAGDALPADGNCKFDNGTDMVVWTKHFTKFVTFATASSSGSSQSSSSGSSTTSTSSGSNRSGSNNGSGSSTSNSEVLGESTTNESTQPSILASNTSTPSIASALFQAPAKSSGKILGLYWYFWVLGLLVIAAAGYLTYAYRSVER